jgi:lipopolysaccharide biosynthesis glycosyltransferase/glycosyltransferase involved in cell wall biosynthesis
MPVRPKVSIVIPVFKVEKYLRRCLDSVVAQTLKDIEIIVIDDASPDNCPKIIDEYAQKDPRIVVVHKKQNEGLGAAYNTGINLTTGEFIGFVESDDWIEKDMYEKFYEKMKTSTVDILKSNFYIHLPGDVRLNYRMEDLFGKDFTFPPQFKFAECKELATAVLGFWSGIYRADFIKSKNILFNDKIRGAAYADISFFWVVMASASAISFIDGYYYHYCQDHENTSVKAVDDKSFALFDQFEFVENYLAKNGHISQLIDVLKKTETSVYSIFYNQILSKYQKEFAQRAQRRLVNVDENLLRSKIFNGNDRLNLRILRGEINRINVVFACNENYAPHLATVIASILTNSKEDNLALYVLSSDLREETKEKINSLKKIRDCEINFIQVDDNYLRKIAPFPQFPHLFSIETYYRLMLPDLLPLIGRCIYIDVDIVVLDDLRKLWLTDIGDNAIGAVRDIDFITVNTASQKLKLEKKEDYFNSGVLVMDLNYLRQNNYTEKFLEFMENNPEKITYVDQCVLNYCLQGKVHYLPLRWNYGFVFFDNAWVNRNRYSKEEMESAAKNPGIIHYFGIVKPWHHDLAAKIHPYYREYIKYAEMTPWKDQVIREISIGNTRMILGGYFFDLIMESIRHLKGTILFRFFADIFFMLYNLILLAVLIVIYPFNAIRKLIKYAKYF